MSHRCENSILCEFWFALFRIATSHRRSDPLVSSSSAPPSCNDGQAEHPTSRRHAGAELVPTAVSNLASPPGLSTSTFATSSTATPAASTAPPQHPLISLPFRRESANCSATTPAVPAASVGASAASSIILPIQEGGDFPKPCPHLQCPLPSFLGRREASISTPTVADLCAPVIDSFNLCAAIPLAASV